MEKTEVSHILLNRVLNISSVGFFALSPDFKITQWSEMASRLFNYDLSDNLPTFDEIIALFTAKSAAHFKKSLSRCLFSGRNEKIEINARIGGAEKYFLFHLLVNKEEELSVSSIFGTIQDITNQKAIQKDLKNLKSTFNVIQNIQDVIWTLDRNLNCKFISNSVFNFFGYSPEDYIKLPLEERLSPQSVNIALSSLKEAVKMVFTGEIDPKDYQGILELQLKTKSGNLIWGELCYSMLIDDNNNFIGFHGITRDISQRKQVQEILQYRLKLESLVNNLSIKFIDLPIEQISDEINESLHLLGLLTNASRSSIYEYSAENETLNLAYEWVDESKNQIQQPRSIKILPGHLLDKLRNFEIVSFDKRMDLQEFNTANFGSGNEFCPSLFLPMRYKNCFIGAMEFDGNLNEEKEWDNELLPILGTIATVLVNAIERKRTEELLRLNQLRQEAILKLVQMNHSNLDLITDYALEQAIRLTESKQGYLTFLNNEEDKSTTRTWNKLDLTSSSNKIHKVLYSLEKAELWREAVKQRVPVIVNKAENSFDKAYSDGHVELINHLNVPLFDEKKIVLVVGVVNKNTDYNDSDVLQLTLLMQSLWRIIKQKRGEEALRESEERYRMLIEQAVDAIFISDISGQFMSGNSKACELSGYSNDELLKLKIQDIFSVKEKGNQPLNYDFLNEGKTLISEGYFIRADGSKMLVETNSKLMPDGTYQTFMHDITQRKKNETELLLAKAKAEESDRLKSAFLANMSHEIRTPLNGILGFAEILKGREINKEDHQEYLEIIQSNGHQLLQIINDIIDISKIEANQVKINHVNFNLNKLFDQLYRNFDAEIKNQKKPNINLRVILGLPENQSDIMADDVRLTQVLSNFLGNSIKFTQEGDIELSYFVKNDFIEFCVKDTGIGLSYEQQGIIFDRFRQADESTSKLYGGTGLGLSINKNLIELMGGKLWVESEMGKGSSFYFTIPYRVEKQLVVDFKEKTKEKKKISWKDKSFLVVEDDPSSYFLLKTILEANEAQVIWAEDGTQAVKIFNNGHIDLILMDMQLPGINGYETCKLIRSHNKEIPIILQTANAFNDDVKKFLDVGFNAYITKPINKKILEDTIDKEFRS